MEPRDHKSPNQGGPTGAKGRLRAASDPGTRTRHLVREFSLAEGGASRAKREVRELARVLFCSNGDWTDVGRMARGVAKDNLVGLTVGLFGLVLIVGLAAALVPAVQDALRLAFYAVVAGVVGLVMWTNV